MNRCASIRSAPGCFGLRARLPIRELIAAHFLIVRIATGPIGANVLLAPGATDDLQFRLPHATTAFASWLLDRHDPPSRSLKTLNVPGVEVVVAVAAKLLLAQFASATNAAPTVTRFFATVFTEDLLRN